MCHSNDTNDTTQNDTKIFFYLFDKFSKISLLLEVSFKNLPKKVGIFFLKFFFEIFAIIFLKIYTVRKKFFVSFCVVSFEWHKWHNTGQSSNDMSIN